MLPLRYPGRWRLAGTLLLVIGFMAALAPPSWMWPPDEGPEIPGLDKWLHAFAFALLAVWFAGQYARGLYIVLGLGLLAFGIAIEVAQAMIPWRAAEWGDLAADCLGIGAGLLVALAGAGGWSLNAEDWIERHIG